MIKTITKNNKTSKKIKTKNNYLEPKESTIFALLNYSKSLVVIENTQFGKIVQVCN
jgi:hypothetical protein